MPDTPPDATTGSDVAASSACSPAGRGPTACRRAPPRWPRPRRWDRLPTARAGRSRPGPIRPAIPAPAPRPPRRRRPGSRARRPPGPASGGRSGPPVRAPRARPCRAPPGPRRTSSTSSASSSERMPPPNSTLTPASRARRTIWPSTARSCGTPVRAPSRSTTWIQRAPAGDVARRQRGRVAVAVLPGEVTLGQADRRAGAQVDGRQQLHHAAAWASAHEVGQQRQPGRARLLRVELRAPQRAAGGQRGHVAAVVAHRHRLGADRRREGVHEVDPGSLAQPAQRRRAPRRRAPRACSTASAGASRPAGSGATVPGRPRGPAAPGLSTEPS